MTIPKAFLITLGLIGIGLSISVAELYILDFFQIDLSENSFQHLLGLITLFTPLIAYVIIFKISDFQLNLNTIPEKIRSFNPKILLYVLIMAIGLELLDRPFFDFKKIWSFYFLGSAEPYHIPEATKFIIYNGLFAIVFAPVLEELLFRKYIFGQLLNRYSTTTSIIVSSLCFAMLHLPSYRNLIPTFIFGVVACLIYKKTKNIGYPLFLHVLANIFWFTLNYLGEPFYSWIFRLDFNYIYWIMAGFGVLLTYSSIVKITQANSSQN